MEQVGSGGSDQNPFAPAAKVVASSSPGQGVASTVSSWKSSLHRWITVMKFTLSVAALQAIVLLLTLGQASASSLPSSQSAISVTADGPAPQGYNGSQFENLLIQNGANFFLTNVTWGQIEISPGKYNMQDTIDGPMTFASQYHFNGVGLIVKMIDTNTLTMPADLENNSFDDPVVQQRFLAMLQAIAQDPSSKRINYILLGNEVDLYLGSNPTQASGFVALLQTGINLIHQEMPWVKVGTITTSSALNNPALFQELTQFSDFIDYTYYPATASQMLPVSQVPGDLNRMAAAAGTKPFAFTEIGYSSSPALHSSQKAQGDFVNTVFNTLGQYRNRIAFVSWSSLADPSPQSCQSYASQQSLSASTNYCAFLDNLGLLTNTGTPKQAWYAFVQDLSQLNAASAMTTSNRARPGTH